MIDEFIAAGNTLESAWFKSLTTIEKEDDDTTERVWLTHKDTHSQALTLIKIIKEVIVALGVWLMRGDRGCSKFGWVFSLWRQEIYEKMDEPELKTRIDCGAILRELDPTIPLEVQDAREDKIYRYKYTRQSAKTTTRVKRALTQVQEFEGSEALLPNLVPPHFREMAYNPNI